MSTNKRRSDSDGPHVLVIDDAEDTREVYALFLRHSGFRASTATNGEDGLKQACTTRPDVIVLDLGLPRMNGCELARRLKNDPATRAIPLIAVTGHARAEEKREALEAGVSEYCVKPCSPSDLLTMIERHLS